MTTITIQIDDATTNLFLGFGAYDANSGETRTQALTRLLTEYITTACNIHEENIEYQREIVEMAAQEVVDMETREGV